MPPSGTFDQTSDFDALLNELKSDLAGLKVLASGLRLLLFLKAGFNPDQPRDDHGRWAGAGGGTRVAQAGGAERYRVVLPDEEARGGHAIRTHVDKSDAELFADLRTRTMRSLWVSSGYAAQGAFDSVESANDFTNRVLEAHPAEVDRVASGASEEEWLETRFGYRTGREAFRPDVDGAMYIRPTYGVGVLIRRDRRSPRGYTVITSYPRNDD